MTAPTTLNELFFGAVARFAANPVAMRHKRDGTWIGIRHRELLERVHRVHAALRDLGLAPGDRVAILSENRPEWAVADYACITARLADVPVYPTLPAHQIEYILRDSGARAIFVSNAEQLAKVREIRGALPALEHVVLFDAMEDGPDATTLAAFEARGASVLGTYVDWEDEARRVVADDLATLIYTSGTTGDPKGVMLTHGNITSNVVAALRILSITDRDECLSFLPLSHIFERMVGHYTMFHAGTVINYATSIDAVGQEMIEVRPTIMASVPRLYEKIYARVVDSAMSGGALKRAIFTWAKGVASEHLPYRLAKRRAPLGLALRHAVADRLVFSKLRARTGGRLRMFVSGGAPLNPEICRFFIGAGLPILEGYGLTETSPVISVNTFELLKPGTVGRPIPGVEVKIAADGEILTRGPHIMRGYYHKPEATAEAIDADGWFHTGDVGELDEDGCLRITDRKKDLIVTAGGKNIAPQPIEAMLKTNKYFVNAVMLGDKRKFPIMLLVPNVETVNGWLQYKHLPTLDQQTMATDPAVREKLEREARKSLRDLAHFEVPKKFLILPHDFSIERGELTPKLSVRRKVVEEHYREEIEALFVDHT